MREIAFLLLLKCKIFVHHAKILYAKKKVSYNSIKNKQTAERMTQKMSKQTICIVDDEKIITDTLKVLLELEIENVEIKTFNSGADALKFLKKESAQVILSDFLMPQMNGIEFLSKAKAINPDASMILLTGYADKENAIKAINEVGIYRYLEKPWDNDDLVLSVKNALERGDLIKQLKNQNEILEQLVKERTRELTEANQKLNAIIHYCADGIATVDNHGNFMQINPAFEKMCAFTPASMKEVFISKENILEKLQSQDDVFLRDILIKNSKRDIPVEISFARIPEGYFVAVIRDITIQQNMERLRDDFIATLTHDLRTPLLASIQTLKFFLDGTLGNLNDKQKEFLSTMLSSQKDMLGLVNALLEVYKYDAGKLVLCHDYFSLNQLISQCINELKPLSENKSLKLSFEGSEIEVFADKQEIRRVVTNLIGNAINHTSKGFIKVESFVDNKHAIVKVSDSGIGIPKEDIDNMFVRFSQGTKNKRSTGTGLGLYLSRQIIEAHGGKISLQSELNKGSTFTFSIPLEGRQSESYDLVEMKK